MLHGQSTFSLSQYLTWCLNLFEIISGDSEKWLHLHCLLHKLYYVTYLEALILVFHQYIKIHVPTNPVPTPSSKFYTNTDK